MIKDLIKQYALTFKKYVPENLEGRKYEGYPEGEKN